MQTEDPPHQHDNHGDGSPEAQRPPERKAPLKTPVVVGLIAGAMLATAFVVAIVRRADPSLKPSLAEGTPAHPAMEVAGESITLLSPAGNTPKGDLRLYWKSSEEFKEYEAVILDTRTRILWRSRKGPETEAKVSNRGLKYLVPGVTHLWYVIGTREDGSTLQTSSSIFIISK
jgi:hypothetical protein